MPEKESAMKLEVAIITQAASSAQLLLNIITVARRHSELLLGSGLLHNFSSTFLIFEETKHFDGSSANLRILLVVTTASLPHEVVMLNPPHITTHNNNLQT
jgi:hypothetical protein